HRFFQSTLASESEGLHHVDMGTHCVALLRHAVKHLAVRSGEVPRYRWSPDSITQCRLDFRACVQSAENLDGSDRFAGKIDGNVGCNHCQAENLDMKRFTGGTDRLELLPAVMTKTEIEFMSNDRPLHRIGVAIELVSDRRPDQVGPIGIEALTYQQIDLTQVDITQVNRDLFAI